MSTFGSPPPRASLAAVPLEVKAHIVELVASQEEVGKDLKDDVSEEARERHVNSLHALASTSKEFYELTAKHIFEVLSEHKARSLFFRFWVSPRHGHRITHAVFIGSRDAEEADLIWSTLVGLPNLRALDLGWGPADTLFGAHMRKGDYGMEPADDTYAERALRWESFIYLAPCITSLALLDFHIGDIPRSPLLASFREVRTLYLLDLDRRGEVDSIMAAVGEGLAGLKCLEHLVVQVDPLRSAPLVNGLEQFSQTPPPLKSLHLNSDNLTLVDWSVILAFSLTLETLHLSYADSALPVPAISFNLIRTLTIGCLPNTPSVLPSLVTPSLISFTYYMERGTYLPDLSLPSLPNFLSANPQLRRVSFADALYVYRDEPPLPDRDQLGEHLVRSSKFSLETFDLPRLRLLDPDPNASYDENDLEFLGDSLVRRLEFANNGVGRIVGEKDVAKAVRWIEVLRRVEDERIEWIA